MSKNLPFTLDHVLSISETHETPFYLYDEEGIRETAQKLNQAFSWMPGCRNFFAVKALPNPTILKILQTEGMGCDASSLAELELSVKAGAQGNDIMFTSNNTPLEEFQRAIEIGAILNLDDITHLDYLLQNNVTLPELISFRYNPGSLRRNAGNVIIGKPEEAKFGVTREQLFAAYKIAQAHGVQRFGLHTMVVSNERSSEALLETAEMLFELAAELHAQLGISLDFVNLGGGFGIPYKPTDQPLDVVQLSDDMQKLYTHMITEKGLPPLRIVTENGRYVTGPHGYLITKVRHLKDTYKHYVGLDATMADLMRPGMYGAYHEVTVLGKEQEASTNTYDVTGSLCENNDKFAVDRLLPKIDIDDIIVIHDAGAHGHAMGFNYNGKLRHAELLLKPDGNVEMIRRAETLQDYFATLNF